MKVVRCPDEVSYARMTTTELRAGFLVENLFTPGQLDLVYTELDRAIVGSAVPLTKALANEWAGKGVNVNAIAPGYIATDNTAALQADPVRNAQILARIPAGRWGKPEDLAGALIFLSSPASNYVNGTILTVDGGWMGR